MIQSIFIYFMFILGFFHCISLHFIHHLSLAYCFPPMAPQHHIQYFWVKNVSLYHWKGSIYFGPQQCWDIKTIKNICNRLSKSCWHRKFHQENSGTLTIILSLEWQRLDFAKPLAKDVTACASDNRCWEEEQGQGWLASECTYIYIDKERERETHWNPFLLRSLQANLKPGQ